MIGPSFTRYHPGGTVSQSVAFVTRGAKRLPRFSGRGLVFLVLLLLAAMEAAAQTQIILKGRVVDDDGAPLANVRVQVRDSTMLEAATTATGTFQVELPHAGTYTLTVQRTGYFVLKQPVTVQATGTEVVLELNPEREVFQSVKVGASPSTVDPDRTNLERHLSGTEINNIPYPASSSLVNALKLIPGNVQDPTGAIHIQGGAAYQTQFTLDGFDISDPITGLFNTPLAVEDIRSVDLDSSRELPQTGRGSAGTLDIKPENGTDQFHFTATNFIPGVSTQNGLHLGDSTPRAGISGPLIKGRAWFGDSIVGQYNDTIVNGLPSGQNQKTSWTAGNLFHAQANLTPANILYGDFLVDGQRTNNAGLGPLTPIPTTVNQNYKEWLAAIKDSHAWSNGSLVEAGFSYQSVYYRNTPQGALPYVITPNGASGNFYQSSRQYGTRKEEFANVYPKVLHLRGTHQFQIGANAEVVNYHGIFNRTSYELTGLTGQPLYQTSFQGSGNFQVPDVSVGSYINDHWQPWKPIVLDVGLRIDWDQLVGRAAPAPRVGLAYSPFENGRTKFVAGYGVIHEYTNLEWFSRAYDQVAVNTPYSPQGLPEPAMPTYFRIGPDLTLPRYDNFSAGAEHSFTQNYDLKLEFLERHTHNGFAYSQEPPPAILFQPQVLTYGLGGTYTLSNIRRDAYHGLSATVRHTFGDQYVWMASYVRSRAVSNGVLAPGVDIPLQVTSDTRPLPWDATNRILSWGYFPVYPRHISWLKNWAWAYLLDYRTGFAFSAANQAGIISGPVDSYRFPANLDLNLHLERRFIFRGYRFALRGGVNNLTNSRNPTAVNSTIGSPQFLQFLGDEGRHFEFRIRFFGKAGRATP